MLLGYPMTTSPTVLRTLDRLLKQPVTAQLPSIPPTSAGICGFRRQARVKVIQSNIHCGHTSVGSVFAHSPLLACNVIQLVAVGTSLLH
jgi:hypothetical protein